MRKQTAGRVRSLNASARHSPPERNSGTADLGMRTELAWGGEKDAWSGLLNIRMSSVRWRLTSGRCGQANVCAILFA
ncbi:MAG: hypothetical protein WB630_01355 [Candidatus Acidiferrales bacterium]